MSDPGSSLPPLRNDGLPTLPTGEPVLARWFVITMLLLVPVAIGITIWAVSMIPRGEAIGPAERRPPGNEMVTIERGDAQLGESMETSRGPDCAASIELIGDDGTRAASERVLRAFCQLLDTGGFPEARAGLGDWIRGDGLLRIATFELSGVESSARVEADRIVVELNAKFLFEDAVRAVPALIHQLALLGEPTWPGAPITAETELAAARVQAEACNRLSFGGDRPRGCLDVAELLADDDPLQLIIDAGFPAAG
jgi:hypothetical protein